MQRGIAGNNGATIGPISRSRGHKAGLPTSSPTIFRRSRGHEAGLLTSSPTIFCRSRGHEAGLPTSSPAIFRRSRGHEAGLLTSSPTIPCGDQSSPNGIGQDVKTDPRKGIVLPFLITQDVVVRLRLKFVRRQARFQVRP